MALVFILVVIQGARAEEELKFLCHWFMAWVTAGFSGCSHLTGMALGTALMLLSCCCCLGRGSMVRVKVSNPLSWSVF